MVEQIDHRIRYSRERKFMHIPDWDARKLVWQRDLFWPMVIHFLVDVWVLLV